LDDAAAPRVVGHLEACPGCREFFDQVRAQVRLHKDLCDPEGLLGRFAVMAGGSDGEHGRRGLENRLLVHRLATVFYQIGKAYTLAAVDAGYRQRVFEPVVSVERERVLGRGFIDGVAAAQTRPVPDRAALRSGPDWGQKRHLLNGTLEKLPKSEDKARRLLEECLDVEHDHEPAHIYLALLDAHEGKVLRASRRLQELFDTAIDPANRGHAASQMGRLLFGEDDFHGALVWFRWLRKSGLADEDDRFAVVRFNIGLCYAHLERPEPALVAFRGMLDRHPARAGQLAEIFRNSPVLRATIDRQHGFAEQLVARCPELFAAGGPAPRRDGAPPRS